MTSRPLQTALMGAALAILCRDAPAQQYQIDPGHTSPNFEADHMGLSITRGKFTKTTGSVTLDRAAQTGHADIVIDATSLDFGNAILNARAREADMFDTGQFPTIAYHGKAIEFAGGQPVAVDGELTLLGVTRPVRLTLSHFKCIDHPRLKREVCGAEASARINRLHFGLRYPPYAPEVKLAIQIEAIKSND
ncbi:YceI family protein [Duganella vulcania]